jgi:hypothetical protein
MKEQEYKEEQESPKRISTEEARSRSASPRPPRPKVDVNPSTSNLWIEIPSVPISHLSPQQLSSLKQTCKNLYDKIKRIRDSRKLPSSESPGVLSPEVWTTPSSTDIQQDLELYRSLKAYLKAGKGESKDDPRQSYLVESPTIESPCQKSLYRISRFTMDDGATWRELKTLSIKEMEEEKSAVKREIAYLKEIWGTADKRVVC